jgi:hypothetical protein
MSIRTKRTAKLRVFPWTPGQKLRSSNLVWTKRRPANRWQDFVSGAVTEAGNLHTKDVKRESTSEKLTRQIPMSVCRGGLNGSSDEIFVMKVERSIQPDWSFSKRQLERG